ncbi:MAG: phosphoenolpyruvate carboxylase [Nitrospinae bacterium]|nr:phosphoenolpyruvate carboxylase [Nitrospinota bacterium]
MNIRQTGLTRLHIQQVDLLRKWRSQDKDEALLEDLLITVNAIASGLKNTG